MKNQNFARSSNILMFSLLLCTLISSINAQSCKPSGKIRGKKPPPGQCNTENNSDCCVEGKTYTTYKCSPPLMSGRTKATLTINSFQKGGDGGAPSECDNKYHSDDTPVVALSTGWFNKKKRCLNFVNIYGNGKSVKAMVDECDSTMGCDADHDYQPPCPNNIVDASKAVWKALGVPEKDRGDLEVYWSDASLHG